MAQLGWPEGCSVETAEPLAAANGVHRSSMSRRLDKLRRRVGARLTSALWEHSGRCSSEISVTHVDARVAPRSP